MDFEKIKPYILSAIHTFVPAFGTVFFGLLSEGFKSGTIQWRLSFFGALIIAAATAGARAVWKEIWERLAPVSLGGVKKL